MLSSHYDIESGEWVVDNSFSYYFTPIPNVDRYFVLNINRGESWDKATIPWPARIIIAKEELGDMATLVHDYLYKHRGQVTDGAGSRVTVSREEVDLIFYHDMKKAGVSWWKAMVAYYAVRLFGSSYWEDDN